MSDTIYTHLKEIEVTGSSYGTFRNGGGIELSREQILAGKHAFGEADFIKTLSGMSGVTTSGDYGSGLMIDGNLPAHIIYRIDHVPIFFPFRFGGIFSTFNTSHFRSVNFERAIHGAYKPSRLGSILEYKTRVSIPDKITGNVNIGLISSALTLELPIGRKFSFSISARASYVDQLYGNLLKETEAKYNFQDYNFTALYRPGENDLISLNGFWSNDNLDYYDSNYVLDMGIRWNNGMVSLSWRHDGRVGMTHRIFASYFKNSLELLMPQLTIKAPSSLLMTGISGEFDNQQLSSNFLLSCGYEISDYSNNVQDVSVANGKEKATRGKPLICNPFEGRIYADGKYTSNSNLRVNVGLSMMLYYNGKDYMRFAPDPRITLILPVSVGNLSFHLGKYTQFLHQVGFSQTGLASDFWILANRKISPETSYNFDIDYSGSFQSIGLEFSLHTYAKRILHQSEYFGEFLSILDSDYNAESFIENANGYALGFNLQLRRNIGKLIGNAGLSYGIVRLRFPNMNYLSRGKSEPGLTFNVDLTYRFNAHWEIGGTFKYMSGRPYTPITALYIVAGNIMCEYGELNSKLLPSRNRLDLSGSYKFKTRGKFPITHLVNLSLINVYGKKNPEFIRYDINIKKGTVNQKYVYSLYRFIPSLSYTIMF